MMNNTNDLPALDALTPEVREDVEALLDMISMMIDDNGGMIALEIARDLGVEGATAWCILNQAIIDNLGE